MSDNKKSQLLLVVLVSMILTVSASATEESGNYRTALEQYQLPVLQFNPDLEKIVVREELNPEKEVLETKSIMGISNQKSSPSVRIPAGSVIYHSRENVTSVFDPSGTQLFAAFDSDAEILSTPAGDRPATLVHKLPSGSILYPVGNRTYVIFNNKIILVEITDSPLNPVTQTSLSSTSGTTDTTFSMKTTSLSNDEIPRLMVLERVSLDYYSPSTGYNLAKSSAQWVVPEPPVVTIPGHVQYLDMFRVASHDVYEPDGSGSWTSSGSLVYFASAAEWNRYAGTWDMATWIQDYNVTRPSYYSEGVQVYPGDVLTGEIDCIYDVNESRPKWNDSESWSAGISDPRGRSSNLSLVAGKMEYMWSDGLVQYFFAESYDSLVDSEENYVGDSTFSNFTFTRQNKIPLNAGDIPVRSVYVNRWFEGKPEFQDMNITNNWPGMITFRTRPEKREVYTFSITNAWVEPKENPPFTSKRDSQRYIENITRELATDAGWAQVFPEINGTNIKKAQFGVNPTSADHTLNEATIHWHLGHGGIDAAGKTAIAIPKIYNATSNDFDNDWVHASDVTTKWGGNNKWVVLQDCYILNDSDWGKVLGTTHGIFGFTTPTDTKSALPTTFLKYAKSGNTLYDSWNKATHEVYYMDVVPTVTITDKDGNIKWDYYNHTVFVRAATRFKTISQQDQDHLPGIGFDPVPDGDSDSQESVPDDWNCSQSRG